MLKHLWIKCNGKIKERGTTLPKKVREDFKEDIWVGMRISTEVFHEVKKEAEGVGMRMRLRTWVITHFMQQDIIRNHPYYILFMVAQESWKPEERCNVLSYQTCFWISGYTASTESIKTIISLDTFMFQSVDKQNHI